MQKLRILCKALRQLARQILRSGRLSALHKQGIDDARKKTKNERPGCLRTLATYGNSGATAERKYTRNFVTHVQPTSRRSRHTQKG